MGSNFLMILAKWFLMSAPKATSTHVNQKITS